MGEKRIGFSRYPRGFSKQTAKDQKVAFFLDSDEISTNVEGWISTGTAYVGCSQYPIDHMVVYL